VRLRAVGGWRMALGQTIAWSAVLGTVLAHQVAAAEVDYPPVLPGYAIEFPRDEGSHPQFRIEWWYVTGWLHDEDGSSVGFQVTFFRSRTAKASDNPSRFAPAQLLFAHAAVSDPQRGRLLHDERAARAGFGLAEAREGDLDVLIEDWSLVRDGERYVATIPSADFALELEFRLRQPPLLQGDRGFSRKGPDPLAASYYYSLPHLAVQGRIVVRGHQTRVTGEAWFDHEWSSRILDPQAVGWDWVGLNLDDGSALMAFRLRDGTGGQHWAGATLRAGRLDAPQTYDPQQVEWQPLRYWRSPRTGIQYPVEWRVRVGGRWLHLVPLMEDQESDSRRSTGTIYWEGAVRALDEEAGELGRGYLELTGYGTRLRL